MKPAPGKVKGKIETIIQPADGFEFFKAEDYHQKYLEENPVVIVIINSIIKLFFSLR